MSVRLSAADSVWQEAVAVVRSVFFTAAYAERVERVGEEGAGWQGPDAPPLRARPACIRRAGQDARRSARRRIRLVGAGTGGRGSDTPTTDLMRQIMEDENV